MERGEEKNESFVKNRNLEILLPEANDTNGKSLNCKLSRGDRQRGYKQNKTCHQ
jgi:hypothetical protein